ncbi:RNA polymerase sigma-70 factor, ECF subfamily [Pseudobutyrivibrio ruminis]|uniref:RNA polymerase sigma-70 factor, ECF subfamily n=1 Tax=Pseudobutyrivibrio ruminis TaxID=46206 RepID=A0A1H7F595_9FIRM|nr:MULTISPECIES: sigma-70 family RNA polymerase sigma factor [Pseudobutyrivibrio]SEK21316.1 RNA polymerase sigma-70 factor, ECF subfamily [Pseudobutyrivibrio ruminis]SFO44572.1 RNA polymerase sigma-70 factor, ECF subfamily [Pseudobutyrivibrio sp. JW11]
MKDEEIIELYFKRNERAIEETDIKYGHYCETIAGNILWNNQDIEECLDDTYMKMWNRIPPTRPRILRAFIGKIVREIALNMYKASKTSKRGGGVVSQLLDELEECLPDNTTVEHVILENELAEIIRDFVRELNERDAYIFTSRYFYAQDISDIAIKFGMTKHNVTVILSRLRKKLQLRLAKEGYLAS